MAGRGHVLLADDRRLEQAAVAGQAVDRHVFPGKDVHAELQGRHRGVELGAQEVGQGKLALGLADDHRAALIEVRDALARHVVVGQNAGAVGLALEALLIELREQLAGGDLRAEQLRGLAEQGDPGIHVVRAVVAVDHGDGLACRGGDHVDLGVELRQRLLQNDHGKDGRAG